MTDYELLIIEGSDCAGKTSLIKTLSLLLNFKIIKGSSFEHSQCTNLELFEKFKEMTKEKMVVFDRFIYSNEVYAQLYEDFAILTDEQRREIENEIKEKALVIYLEADIETLTSRMNNRGDDYVTTDRLQGIKDKYEDSLANIGDVKVIRIDTSDLTHEDVVELVWSELHNDNT